MISFFNIKRIEKLLFWTWYSNTSNIGLRKQMIKISVVNIFGYHCALKRAQSCLYFCAVDNYNLSTRCHHFLTSLCHAINVIFSEKIPLNANKINFTTLLAYKQTSVCYRSRKKVSHSNSILKQTSQGLSATIFPCILTSIIFRKRDWRTIAHKSSI